MFDNYFCFPFLQPVSFFKPPPSIPPRKGEGSDRLPSFFSLPLAGRAGVGVIEIKGGGYRNKGWGL